jgi:adenosylcobinamide kinase/adenosylcobinamide-phosphate guanylyltransferase
MQCGEPVVYVATAAVSDAEMAERIAHHQARRPTAWATVEAPTDIAKRIPTGMTTLIIEDLTILLANHMAAENDSAEALTIIEIESLMTLQANVIVVSNEVGMGIVPPYPLGRAFRDALGRVNQLAACMCDEVYLIVAGLPLRLK